MAEANGGAGEDGGAARRPPPTRRRSASFSSGEDCAEGSNLAGVSDPYLGNAHVDADAVTRDSTPGARPSREQLDIGFHLENGVLRTAYVRRPRRASAPDRPDGRTRGSLPLSFFKFPGFFSSKKRKVEEKQQPNLTGGSAAGLGPNRGSDAPDPNGNHPNPKDGESKN